jgi:hypothetical protein
MANQKPTKAVLYVYSEDHTRNEVPVRVIDHRSKVAKQATTKSRSAKPRRKAG